MNLRLLAAAALVFLLSACDSHSGREFAFLGRPIIGGVADTSDAHRAIMVVYDPVNGYLCTGTAITPRMVLTAAHCITSSRMEVGYGNSFSWADWMDVSEQQVHPRFEHSDYEIVNDVALLRLEEDIPPDVDPIPHLPYNLRITSADIGSPLEYVGYGATSGDGEGAGTKRTMTNDLAWICESSWCGWDNPGSENTICQDQTPSGTCQGDSGGPALVVRQGREYVAGITSYGGQNCEDFGCSTKVDQFEDFINGAVGQPDGEACSQDSDCHSRFCEDSVCCESDCPGECKRCDLPGLVGLCRDVQDGTDCSNADRCDGDERCQAGVCTADLPLDCDDGNPCTRDSCDPGSGCSNVVLTDGTFCNNETVCDGSEACLNGVCIAGIPPVCEDDDPCTQNWCDDVGGCMQQPRPDGYPCDDSGKWMCLDNVCVEVPDAKEKGCGCGAARPTMNPLPGLLLLGILLVLLRK